MPLYEDARPSSWSAVVGQDKVLAKLDKVRQQGGLIGNAYLLCGGAGTGKSTISALICAEVCGSSDCVTTIGARKLKTEELEAIVERCSRRPLFGKAWGIIVEEAHELHGHIINDLKVVLETPAVQRNSVWCFTSTPTELDAKQGSLFGDQEAAAGNPFLSRCHLLEMDCGEQATLAFACHLRKIAQAASLDGADVTKYVQLVRDNRWNLRRCLQLIQEGVMAS